MKTCILTPYFGQMDIEHAASCHNAIKSGRYMQHKVYNCSLVDHARSYLLAYALQLPEELFDTVLWIDHDIVFDLEEADALVKASRNMQSTVGALVIIKAPGGAPMIRGVDGLRKFGKNGRCYPCTGLPFGFTAMPLEHLRAMVKDREPVKMVDGSESWDLFRPRINPENRAYQSEDYSFFDLYLEHGFQPYVDTRVRVGHKGSYIYMIEDAGITVPCLEDGELDFSPKKDDHKPLRVVPG